MESVRVRFRPVLMTAFGTIAGMIPLPSNGPSAGAPFAAGQRRHRRALVGTILTLIYIPMFAYSVEGRNAR